MVRRNNHRHPEHAQQADARERHNRRNQRIARAAHRAGKDFDEDVGDIRRHNQPHDGQADFKDLSVVAEQAEQGFGNNHQHPAEQERHRRGNAQTDVDALLHAIIEPRAEILADKGCDGDAERIDDHPIHAVHLAVSGVCRHDVRAEAVDARLNDDVGERIHDGLQTGGQADADNAHEHIAVKTNLFELHAVDLRRTAQRHHHQHGADHLTEHRRRRRARNAHIEADDQHDVQHDVRHGRADQEEQRPSGIADGAQDARADVVNQRRNHAQKIDVDVGHRVPQHILRRAHHHQHGSARPNAEHGQRRAAGQRQRHRRVHRAGHVVRPARTEKLRNNDRRAGRQADEKADQQIDQRARRAADRRQRLLADKLADDNGVRRVIELLEKCAQHNREKEQQELFPDNAFSHGVLQVLLFLGHTHSSIQQSIHHSCMCRVFRPFMLDMFQTDGRFIL